MSVPGKFLKWKRGCINVNTDYLSLTIFWWWNIQAAFLTGSSSRMTSNNSNWNERLIISLVLRIVARLFPTESPIVYRRLLLIRRFLSPIFLLTEVLKYIWLVTLKPKWWRNRVKLYEKTVRKVVLDALGSSSLVFLNCPRNPFSEARIYYQLALTATELISFA